MNFRKKFDILKIIADVNLQLKFITSQAAQAKKANEKLLGSENIKNQKHHRSNIKSKLQECENICGISLAINHVSWAKISVSELSVLDWDAYSLPPDFLDIDNESKISPLAREIKQNIPEADFYLMENQKKWNSPINEIYLRAMLVLLLDSDRDKKDEEILFLQKTSVLNRTHSLLIGNERTSARPVVSNLLKLLEGVESNSLNIIKIPKWYHQIQLTENLQDNFYSATVKTQESLSVALLLTLSFLNKYHFSQ